MLGSTLFIIALLVGLFVPLFFFDPNEPPSQGAIAAFSIIRSLLALVGQSLLVLGLVGLYVRQSEATGGLGLIAFLMTFFGLVMILASFPGSDLAVTFGWALFGVATLKARVYPRPAAILLLIGAVATGVVSALLGGLGDTGEYLGVGATIILNGAIAWLGYSLFMERSFTTADHPQP